MSCIIFTAIFTDPVGGIPRPLFLKCDTYWSFALKYCRDQAGWEVTVGSVAKIAKISSIQSWGRTSWLLVTSAVLYVAKISLKHIASETICELTQVKNHLSVQSAHMLQLQRAT